MYCFLWVLLFVLFYQKIDSLAPKADFYKRTNNPFLGDQTKSDKDKIPLSPLSELDDSLFAEIEFTPEYENSKPFKLPSEFREFIRGDIRGVEPLFMDLQKTEKIYNTEYQRIIENYPNIKELIRDQVSDLKEKTRIEYDWGSLPLKESHIIIIGGGPVGIFLAIQLALLDATVTVIEKRTENPSRPQMFRYEQDLEGVSDITKLLGKETWKQLLQEGFVSQSRQDVGDFEIFNQPGAFFDTIPVYLQEILLREMMRYLPIKFLRGAVVESIEEDKVFITQHDKRFCLEEASLLIGSSGTQKALLKNLHNETSYPQTDTRKGLIINFPNIFSWINGSIDVYGKGNDLSKSIFSQGDYFLKPHFLPENLSTTHSKKKTFRNLCIEKMNPKGALSHIDRRLPEGHSVHWNSGSSRAYLRIASGEINGKDLLLRGNTLLKTVKTKNFKQQTIEPKDINPFLDELKNQQQKYINQLVTKDDFEKNIKSIEAILMNYEKAVLHNLSSTETICLNILDNNPYWQKEDKKDLLNNLTSIKTALSKVAIFEDPRTAAKEAQNAVPIFQTFNRERLQASLNGYEKFLNNHSIKKDNQLKLLKKVENQFSKSIKEFSFHTVNLEETFDLYGLQQDLYIKNLIQQYKALQIYIEALSLLNFFQTDYYSNKHQSKKDSSGAFVRNLFLSTLAWHIADIDVFLDRNSAQIKEWSLCLFYLYFEKYLLTMPILKDKFHWQENHFPIVRIFNNEKQVYMGIEYPPTLHEDQKESYVKTALSLYFHKDFTNFIFALPIEDSANPFSKQIYTVDINIKKSTVHAGYTDNEDKEGKTLPFFLIGDESVNAHFLTGSGVLSGWESATNLCELLKSDLSIKEMQDKHNKLQEHIAETLVYKSEAIHILTAQQPAFITPEHLHVVLENIDLFQTFFDYQNKRLFILDENNRYIPLDLAQHNPQFIKEKEHIKGIYVLPSGQSTKNQTFVQKSFDELCLKSS